MTTKPFEDVVQGLMTNLFLPFRLCNNRLFLLINFTFWLINCPFLCFNKILDLIRMALDNIFERVCLQYPLTIYPGSTLWKMCANLDLLVIKIRQYYDKPPTISHIFILQWAQNIYDVEFGFLWYFRKTFWFNACNGRDFETNISSNCMSFLMKFRKNSATLYTQFSLVDVTASPHRKFYF